MNELEQAVNVNDFARTESLLLSNADPNVFVWENPLFFTLREGNFETAKLLIKHGANSSKRHGAEIVLGGRGLTEAIQYVRVNDERAQEMYSFLKSHGADLNAAYGASGGKTMLSRLVTAEFTIVPDYLEYNVARKEVLKDLVEFFINTIDVSQKIYDFNRNTLSYFIVAAPYYENQYPESHRPYKEVIEHILAVGGTFEVTDLTNEGKQWALNAFKDSFKEAIAMKEFLSLNRLFPEALIDQISQFIISSEMEKLFTNDTEN